ncbi:hypothetical protein B0T11DRAFT_327155 [Plectosphaerella cucumerina]|uniref:Conidiation-specific protein 8 n=1 Tax=Plectosphaerella cucumerina TaxID=40658 RepID=A0A8K0X6M0_9PEZI|nr:hypothetical protein B0T11DRAFT_327155 [Plectosphaerella cucumerina]
MDPSKAVDASQNSPTSGRRRSSNTMFQSLHDSRNASGSARRQSLHDQKPEAGFLGKMWQNFTQHSPPK